MIDYKDYIKSEADENGTLWHWIETPFFKPSDFNEAIVRNYNHRLKFVTKNELSIENEIEFIKEELTDLQGLIKVKPSYNFDKLCFASRISGDCWFSDETLNEFKGYLKEYYNYKIKEFQADYLKNRLKDLLEPKQPEPIAAAKKDDFVFHTGLTLATGKAQEMYKSNKPISFDDLAVNLGFKKSQRSYFSATINNNKNPKNLYNNKNVMKRIYNYCIENKKDMCDDFLEKYNKIEPE